MYSIPKSIQTYILNILYEYDEIYNTDIYLVNKHFFTVYKSIFGSQLNFIIESHEDEIKFKSFVKFVTNTDRLYNKPHFIYEQLDRLNVYFLDTQQIYLDSSDHGLINESISKLLKSKQWNEWNKELINSNRNHGIDVQIIDPYYYLGVYQFDLLNSSEQITNLDICIDLERECSNPPPNLQTLSLSTHDNGHGEPDVSYDQLISVIREKCKHITKLSLSSSYCFISDPKSNTMKLLNSLGGQLARLEILGKQVLSDHGYSFSLIKFLKEHPNIKEFGFTEEYSSSYGLYANDPHWIVDYLFREECHIETITKIWLYSNSIPTIKRRIPFMLVSIRMITDYDMDSRLDNTDINKEELKQQIDKAIIEFSNIDHLVLCYCNEEYDYFLIDDFVRLANAVKDHNSSLNKKVEIYFRNMKYQLLNRDIKELSRRISKFKTENEIEYSIYSDDDSEEDGENEEVEDENNSQENDESSS